MEDQTKKHLAAPASQVGNSSGNRLPPDLQHQFEASFGANLSEVRVHESHTPTMLGARSYAHGNDIFFAPGQYQPHSGDGKELLQHELTHVVQQGGTKTPTHGK